jgi:hypothetical protein
MGKKDVDTRPPRFMVVLVDFKTNVQIQVGAPEMADFLKPLNEKAEERFELERVIRFFENKVKEAEKDPWAVKSKKKAAHGKASDK